MRRPRFSARREVAIGLAVYAVYLLVREAVMRGGGRGRAERNGQRIVDLERRLGFHAEPRAQRALLRHPRFVAGLNAGYAVFNVGLTVGWLLRLYGRRDSEFHRLRRASVLAHLGAQPVFLVFPAAPPRTLVGFVDTLRHVSGIDLGHPSLVRFYNPVAAMPSIHVAFAVVTAASMAERSGSAVGRAAALAYPPLVSVVVVGTGNHYVLDAVAGAALGLAARRLA